MLHAFKEKDREDRSQKRERSNEGRVGREEDKKEGNRHEKSLMGELNTIAGGFLAGGVSSAFRKRYARSIMHLAKKKIKMPSLPFTKDDLEDVFLMTMILL